MTKQFLVKTEWQLRLLSFVLFSGSEEEFWRQLKVNGKMATLFFLCRWFSFGENPCLILDNFDTIIEKICVSRPLGTTRGKRYLINKAKTHCKCLYYQYSLPQHMTFFVVNSKWNKTRGPAHLTPGPGIYFNAFIHVYSIRAGADNPMGTNVDVNRKPLAICPFVECLKQSLSMILNTFLMI